MDDVTTSSPAPDSPHGWQGDAAPVGSPSIDEPLATLQSHSRQAFAARRFRYRNEATRDRDVLRYIRTWEEMYKPAQLRQNSFAEQAERPVPAACPDTALAAFAQLAAIRMQSRRCLITLTCATTEWVLADCSTQTALQYTSNTANAIDRPWIGTSSFPRCEALIHHALGEWRNARRARESPVDGNHYYTGGLSEHAFIIEDLQHNSNYQGLGVVRHGSWIRFHCAVPLRDAMGSVLGSLTLLDDKPRYGVSATELTLLEDLADTIVEHLSATFVRARRQRGERLIASLGLFHAGKDSLREWWLAQDDLRVLNTGRNVDKGTTSDRQDRVDAEFGFHPHSQGGDHDPGPAGFDRRTSSDHVDPYVEHAPDHATNPHSPDNCVKESIDTGDQRPSPSDSSGRGAKETQQRGGVFDLARATASTYRRASNLLREALGADGIAFLDAGNVTVPLPHPVHTTEKRAFDDDDSAELSAKESSDADASDSNIERTDICKILGTSVRTQIASPNEQDQVRRIHFPERYLQRLIKRCPNGFICHFDQQGQAYSSSTESSSQSSSEEIAADKPKKRSEYQRLAKIFGGVRVLSAYPLWDDGYGRWRSCVFAWATSVGHYLDQSEDLMFLKSFGNSMLAELSRLQSIAADMSKASFISSISHELRSPLHGILAGAEFLLETQLTDFQLEMTHAVSMAGRTLLDTVDHVLDYSKIQSSVMERKGAPKIGPPAQSDCDRSENLNVASPTDLARLTEEVVEAIVTGHRLHNRGTQSPRSKEESYTTVSPIRRTFSSAALASSSVSISLNIAHRRNWIVVTQPGGWTRILTNLIGNAIKYTHDGHISIRLSVGEPLESGLQGSQRCPVQLTVEDTGIGMSDAFLAHGLFTPFQQENPHAAGTGLGLSIVKQIARSMGAELEISSKMGKGTTAQIRFIAPFVADVAAVDVAFTPDSLPEFTANLRIDQLQLLPQPSSQATKADLVLSNSIVENVREWLKSEIVTGTEVVKGDGTSLCGITEQNLNKWLRERPELLTDILKNMSSKHSHLFVFGQTMHSMTLPQAFETLPITPIFIHQPIGPRKLLRAIGIDRELILPSQKQSRQSKARTSTDKQTNDMTKSATLTSSTPRIEPADTSSVSVGNGDLSRASKENEERDTVLLVEDNEVNMKLLVALVTRLKVPYRCAINGLEALDLYKEGPSKFFLVLMDMSMPVMDGFVATSEIRQEESKRKLKRTFIIALTGVTDLAERQRAFDSGIDEFYNKPVRMKELKGFIDAARQRLEWRD